MGETMSLSDRIRPNSEAAPWVIKEVKELEARLALSESQIVWGFYEEEVPQYGQGKEWEHEICSPVTAEEANRLVGKITSFETALAASRAETTQLNNLLRAVGWGQGEIDSAACIEEENERLRKVILMAADWMFAVSCGTEKAQMHEVEDELRAALTKEKP